MKKTLVLMMSFAVLLFSAIGLSAMDEAAIYANMLMESPIFPDHSFRDPVEMTAEMNFEKKAALKYRDLIPKDTAAQIENLLKDKENALKIFFMKYRELSKLDYTQDMFKDYYKNNIDKFSSRETREIWYLFISSYVNPETQDWEKAKKEKAQAEIELLLKSKPMESLASQFDQNPIYANKCRKLGPILRGKYPKEIDNVIFSLKEGEETPDFIQTAKGFVRIKLLKINPSKPYPYEEVKNNIQQTVISQGDLKFLSGMKENLFKKYGIAYKWEEWKEKTKEEKEQEWDILCKKLSLSMAFASGAPQSSFEEPVFNLVLLKEFETVSGKEMKTYEFMKILVENRHLAMKGLEQLGLKKATRDYTEEEMKDFYEKNPGNFYQKGIIEARMATFKSPRKHKIEALSFNSPKEVADYFHTALKRGDSFEELANMLSEDDFAKNGGYVGVVDEEKSQMGAIFDINAFQLKQGEYTQPLRKPAKGEYIIIKADKVIREKKLLPFDQVKDKVREVLIKVQLNEILVNTATEMYEAAKKDVPEDVKKRDKIIIHAASFNWD